MELSIRRLRDSDLETVVQFSLLAWEPIFVSFRAILGADVYLRIYPDWAAQQRTAVETVCKDSAVTVWLALVDDRVVGFIAYKLNEADKTGEVEMLAVHPDFQNRGIGTVLNGVALEQMKSSGMTLVVVDTGGDPSHAPAQKAYEKAGYTALPLVRYYKKL